jgi:hypothetical protein
VFLETKCKPPEKPDDSNLLQDLTFMVGIMGQLNNKLKTLSERNRLLFQCMMLLTLVKQSSALGKTNE